MDIVRTYTVGKTHRNLPIKKKFMSILPFTFANFLVIFMLAGKNTDYIDG